MGHPLRIAVLGSTGSIGCQSLDVIARYPDRFQVAALVAGRNTKLLAEQVARFRPAYTWAEARDRGLDDALAVSRSSWTPTDEIAAMDDVDLVLVGTAGAAGLLPTLRALECGKPVAIANKEVLVMAGHLVRRALNGRDHLLRPVDSEHSAIWQCLWGEESHAIRRIILTASGGAFRDLAADELANVTPEQALNHPTWNMGGKITIDSASLMNKGMETIEAMWLFDVPMEKVEVVLHRESIVHSLVEFSDGSVKAQLGYPDMRLPIELALAYPERMPERTSAPLDLASIGSLNFGSPDMERFPCLRLAIEAGTTGGTMPAVMAAADEVAVEAFTNGRIGFTGIPSIIEAVMSNHTPLSNPELDAVLEADRWSRDEANRVVAKAGA